MTRIDFYISPDSHAQARELLACRIIEKAWQQKSPVYVHTASSQQSEQLDQLLWTFRAQSFIPHSCSPGDNSQSCTILIGHTEPPEQQNEVLINLANDIPMFFSRFNRVVELVHEETETKQRGRERYKFYKDRGYALNTHNLKGK